MNYISDPGMVFENAMSHVVEELAKIVLSVRADL